MQSAGASSSALWLWAEQRLLPPSRAGQRTVRKASCIDSEAPMSISLAATTSPFSIALYTRALQSGSEEQHSNVGMRQFSDFAGAQQQGPSPRRLAYLAPRPISCSLPSGQHSSVTDAGSATHSRSRGGRLSTLTS